MTNFESALITRIIDTGDFASAKKITSDFFFTPAARSAWNFIVTYRLEYGATPSRDMLVSSVPNFEFGMAMDSVSALVEKVNERYVYNEIALTVERLAELSATDVYAAQAYLAEAGLKARLLGARKEESIDLVQTVAEEIDAYYRRKTLKGILGLPWPWERLNRATYGLQDGQLVVFYARPKNFKTFLMLYVLHEFHYRRSRRIVVFTREMRKEALRQRYCALWAALDYTRYCMGRLTNIEEARWREAMEAFAEAPSIIVETADGSGAEAADEIVAKAQQHQADVVGIDGLHLFGNREWEEMAALTSRLKYHALNTYKIPYVGTSQGAKQKRDRGNPDDVMYSDSLLQDADYLIKCVYVAEDQRIYLSLPAIREGQYCEFSVWAKPAYDFTQAFVTESVTETECDEGSSGDEFVQA